jgi:predicted membrane protein
MEPIKSYTYPCRMTMPLTGFLLLAGFIIIIVQILDFIAIGLTFGNIIFFLAVLLLLMMPATTFYAGLRGKNKLLLYKDRLTIPKFFLTYQSNTIMFKDIKYVKLSFGELLIICQQRSYGINRSGLKKSDQEELYEFLTQHLQENPTN